MTNIKIIRSAAFILFSIFLVCGCQPPRQTPIDDEFPMAASDMRKLELQQRLNRKFNDPQVHYELGKIYQSEGLWDKAISEFVFAKSCDPVSWKSAAAIVKTYYQDGKNKDAIKASQKYINQAAYSASSSMNLGKAFQAELLDDEALACYNQALKIAPNSAELNKQIGYYYFGKNDLIRAEQHFRRSFEIEPTSEVSEALGRLGITVDLPGFKRPEIETPEVPEEVE